MIVLMYLGVLSMSRTGVARTGLVLSEGLAILAVLNPLDCSG